MYIERKVNESTGEVKYIMDGEKELGNFFVFVNGKRVSADIIAIDSKEGWVDIELPVLEDPVVVDKQTVAPNDGELPVATHTMTTRRLQGDITFSGVVA